MHSNCKQNIYEFTEICCNVLNFSLAHKSAQLFMGVAALIEPQAALHHPSPLADYPLQLTQQLLSSVCLLCCYFRYKLSAHIFAVLPIFNYTSCNMYRSPRTHPPSPPLCLWHLQPLRIGALLCAMRRTVALSSAPAAAAVAPVTAFHYCTSTYTII